MNDKWDKPAPGFSFGFERQQREQLAAELPGTLWLTRHAGRKPRKPRKRRRGKKTNGPIAP